MNNSINTFVIKLMNRFYQSLHIILLLIMASFLTACSTTKTVQKVEPAPEPLPIEHAETIEQIEEPKLKPTENVEPQEDVAEEEAEEPIVPKGTILAKTAFEGVLKADYVSLVIKGQGDNEYKFQLNIGRDTDSKPFSWDVKPVEPGYFYVELPVGPYKIESIAIPVGSTKAEEPINIDFEVAENTVTYIGTLSAEGTKEKIKLGGVPVIKPGFEYTAQILNEHDEALQTLQSKFPQFNNEISVNLMVLHEQENPPQN